MMRQLGRLLLALVLVSLAASGCGKSIYVMDVRDNLAKLKQPPGEVPAARRPGTIAVQIVGAPTMGAIGSPLGPQPLVPVPARADEEKRAFKQVVESSPVASGGVLVKGVGEVARALLQRHLARYFDGADVQLVPSPVEGFQGVTVSRMQLTLIFGFYTRSAAFSFVANPPGLPEMVGQGVARKANAAGHLGWALPLSLLTFPLGLAIASGIMSSVYRGMEEAKTVEAIDLAAASLAAQIAGVSPPPAALLR